VLAVMAMQWPVPPPMMQAPMTPVGHMMQARPGVAPGVPAAPSRTPRAGGAAPPPAPASPCMRPSQGQGVQSKVCCKGVTFNLQSPMFAAGAFAAVVLEVDGVPAGRSSLQDASQQKARWDEVFYVPASGRCLTVRIILAVGPEEVVAGECRVNLQASLTPQQDGGILSVPLQQRGETTGTFWFTVSPPSSAPAGVTNRQPSDAANGYPGGYNGRQEPGAAGSPAPMLPKQALKRRDSGGLQAGTKTPTTAGGQNRAPTTPTPRGQPTPKSQAPATTTPKSRQAMATATPKGPGVGTTPRSQPVQGLQRAQTQRESKSPGPVASQGRTTRTYSMPVGDDRSPKTPTPMGIPRAKSDGKRLAITPKGHNDMVELMQSKDKLRYYAERPFRRKGNLEGRLNYREFTEAFDEVLEEIELSKPSDVQMQQLFDKHRAGTEGVKMEDFESLMFRFLCFIRATQEVDVTPTRRSNTGEERDKQWRQEFIRTKTARFDDVYVRDKQLGKGSFGVVFSVAPKLHKKGTKRFVRVCKIISKEMAKRAGTSEVKVREEFAVLKRLDHPHVLRIFEDFEDETNFYLVMESCVGGDLGAYLRNLGDIDAVSYERWVAKVMQHTLSAIAYCHGKSIIHKDLKPENVMLSTTRDTPVQDMHVVVVDFGLAEMFQSPTDRSNIVSGTPPYMAPEVWAGNAGKSCDIWSCGVIMFFLLSGRLPFHGRRIEEFPQLVRREPDWALMGGATPEAQRFCKRMLQKMEHQRPSARDSLKDLWFEAQGCNAAGDQHVSPSRAVNHSMIRNLTTLGERTNFEKFIARLVATQLDASQQKKVNDAFRAFDADGDGLLSREELKQGLASLGVSGADLEQVVNELDVGNNGAVSYTEFLAGMTNVRAKSPEEREALLWIAWQQFNPDERGRVRTTALEDALAARGFTVADVPPEFLEELSRDSTGYVDFAAFERLLGQDKSSNVLHTLLSDSKKSSKLLRWFLGKTGLNKP